MSRKQNNLKSTSNYRFPLWIAVFFLLLFLVPLLIILDFLLVAKIIGICCLILVVVALRYWLRLSRLNSESVPRVVLNKNQIFDLERKYFFLRGMDISLKKIILHRTGIILAEVQFIQSQNQLNWQEIIEIAFNFSILLLEHDQSNLRGLIFDISINYPNHQLSIEPMYVASSQSITFDDYKLWLSNTSFAKYFFKLYSRN